MTADRFRFEDLPTAPLVPGAVYEGGTAGNAGDDPISHLVPVGNAGGIRYKGSYDDPPMVVLYSTGQEDEWADSIDDDGVVTYHGDARTPGRDLLDTPRSGNRLLHALGERGLRSGDHLTPFLIFTKADTGPSRSVVFNGLAVAGTTQAPESDWLVAKWFETGAGRFLNYVLLLELVDTGPISRSDIDAIGGGDRRRADAIIRRGLSGDSPKANT